LGQMRTERAIASSLRARKRRRGLRHVRCISNASMETDPKVAADEARRASQHESVKSQLRGAVNAELAEGVVAEPHDREEVRAVGRELEQHAVREIAESEGEVRRGRGAARVAQVVDYLFFVIYGLIGLEIVLELVGARDSNPFKHFVDAITSPVLAPFHGLVRDPGVGSFRFMFSFVAALVAYLLLHLATRGLLKLVGVRKTAL